MRKSLIWIVPLMLVTAAVAGELEIGSDIPMADVKMVDVSGKKVSLNDAVGENGLLVVFSCNTCPWVDAWEDRYISVSKLSQKKGSGHDRHQPQPGKPEKRRRYGGHAGPSQESKVRFLLHPGQGVEIGFRLRCLQDTSHLPFSTIKVHWSTAAP